MNTDSSATRRVHLADYDDITYEIDEAAAVITINRPERYNAFRGQTVEELIKAFRAAWADSRVSAIILTGAGDKAFCTGGDVKQRAETNDYGPTESGTFEIGYAQADPRRAQAGYPGGQRRRGRRRPCAACALRLVDRRGERNVRSGGPSNMAMSALEIFVHTDEGMEGSQAFAEKRPTDFARYVTA